MKAQLIVIAFALIGLTAGARAQLTAEQAVKGMARGINIGNSLDAPTETAWGNPPIQERYFSDLKKAGFEAVRIPVTWANHVSWTPPYTINSTFFNRVDTVIDWALKNHLFVVMDAHHETWLKTALADTATNISHADSCIARFDSIWSQIATRFKDKSDSLIFEILNEPYPMAENNVNALNVRILRIIRRTNPTRIVSYSGYMWSNSDQLVTAEIPDSGSKYLIGYYHSYDPNPFGLVGTGTYGSASDIAKTKAKFDQVTAWSKKNSIPVILDEFGFIDKCAFNSQMCAYATDMDQALQHGVPAFVWDDGHSFGVYNRTTYKFNEIKDVLIYTYPQSPDHMMISQLGPDIKLQWQNRNPESDSITIQRGPGPDDFSDRAVVGPTDSVFVDSLVIPGVPYYYRLKIIKQDSTEIQSYPIMRFDFPVTAVKSTRPAAKFGLSSNYPNPFNPTTVIRFGVGSSELVGLRVYDVLGRLVKTLVDKVETPGNYEVRFNGAGMPTGVYFCRMEADGFSRTIKMLLLK